MTNHLSIFGTKNQPVAGPGLWNRTQISADNGWRYQLSKETLHEIAQNIDKRHGFDRQLRDVDPSVFPLPSFANQAKTIKEQLSKGRGIAQLSGLNVGDYTVEELKYIFTALASHIGVTVSQSHLGDYIGEVMDRRDPQDERRYHNGGEFVMHRDPTADVTALLSIRKALSGGMSRIMSAAALHNHLLQHYPDLMETIYQGFYYRRTTPDRGNTALYTDHPIPTFYFYDDGEFMAHFIPYFSEDSLERDKIPDNHILRHALAAIKQTIWDTPELYLEYLMEPGDIQFVNNRTTLHSRTNYQDAQDINQARLLLRVWMQLPGLKKVPDQMQYFLNRDRADGGIAKASEQK